MSAFWVVSQCPYSRHVSLKFDQIGSLQIPRYIIRAFSTAFNIGMGIQIILFASQTRFRKSSSSKKDFNLRFYLANFALFRCRWRIDKIIFRIAINQNPDDAYCDWIKCYKCQSWINSMLSYQLGLKNQKRGHLVTDTFSISSLLQMFFRVPSLWIQFRLDPTFSFWWMKQKSQKLNFSN